MKDRTFYAILAACLTVWSICIGTISQYRIDTEGWRIYSINEAYEKEVRLCNATSEMLHAYYQFLDVELDEDGDTISRHNFFWDCISESDCYRVADEIREGDWEDFFKDWDYGRNGEDSDAVEGEEDA